MAPGSPKLEVVGGDAVSLLMTPLDAPAPSRRDKRAPQSRGWALATGIAVAGPDRAAA
jgi:hypothetical protein